jgi:hypothetical protein
MQLAIQAGAEYGLIGLIGLRWRQPLVSPGRLKSDQTATSAWTVGQHSRFPGFKAFHALGMQATKKLETARRCRDPGTKFKIEHKSIGGDEGS